MVEAAVDGVEERVEHILDKVEGLHEYCISKGKYKLLQLVVFINASTFWISQTLAAEPFKLIKYLRDDQRVKCRWWIVEGTACLIWVAILKIHIN